MLKTLLITSALTLSAAPAALALGMPAAPASKGAIALVLPEALRPTQVLTFCGEFDDDCEETASNDDDAEENDDEGSDDEDSDDDSEGSDDDDGDSDGGSDDEGDDA